MRLTNIRQQLGSFVAGGAAIAIVILGGYGLWTSWNEELEVADLYWADRYDYFETTLDGDVLNPRCMVFVEARGENYKVLWLHPQLSDRSSDDGVEFSDADYNVAYHQISERFFRSPQSGELRDSVAMFVECILIPSYVPIMSLVLASPEYLAPRRIQRVVMWRNASRDIVGATLSRVSFRNESELLSRLLGRDPYPIALLSNSGVAEFCWFNDDRIASPVGSSRRAGHFFCKVGSKLELMATTRVVLCPQQEATIASILQQVQRAGIVRASEIVFLTDCA